MRLFVAIPLPLEGQAQVRRYREKVKAAYPGFRWTPPERLHITLRFLGEADAATVTAAQRALSSIAGGPPIALWFATPTFLPSLKQPNAFALHVRGESEELAALYERTLAAFERVGIQPDDRPFLPHVTIAREDPRSGTMPVAGVKAATIPRAWFRATSVVLFASHADGSGRRYEPLATLPLVDA